MFEIGFIAFVFVCVVCRQFVSSYQQANDIRYKRMVAKMNSIQKQIY